MEDLIMREARVKVSIVTPVFNQSSTLEETIESVLNQTYEDIDYIIVNDGSTDNINPVLEKYQGLIHVINQDHQGQAAALNKGWASATGNYICYLSADDIIYKHAIKTMVDNIDGDSIVLYPDFDLIDVNSNVIKTIKTPEFQQDDLVSKLICQPGLLAVFKSDLISIAGGWNQSYRFIPDFEFWARASQYGNFKRVPEVLGGFRVHEQSGSVRSVSEASSDELIRFVNNFKYHDTCNQKKAALSRAFLMSARSHMQSGRFLLGCKRYLACFKISPLAATRPASLFFVFNGLVRRFYYRLRAIMVDVF